MKKVILSVISVLLVCMMAIPASAATSAFSKIMVTKDVVVIDDTADQGGNGKPIQYVENYGIGYSQINDVVVFKDIDFGKNGAKEMVIFFGYGGTSKTTLDIYVDDYKTGKPVCSYSIEPTGGWDITKAKELTQPVKIASGVHTVYVKFTNKESGSFSYLYFKEADAVATTAAATTKAAATTAAKAPQTSDLSVIPLLFAAAVSGGVVIGSRKRRSR